MGNSDMIEEIYECLGMLRFLNDILGINSQISQLTVTLARIVIRDSKSLLMFFELMDNILNKVYFNRLEVSVQNVNTGTFMTCLCDLFNQNKVQGSVCISVPKECVGNAENLRKLEQVALRNTSWDDLS